MDAGIAGGRGGWRVGWVDAGIAGGMGGRRDSRRDGWTQG